MQTGRAAGTGSFTANGLPSSHNSYLLDGIDNNNDTIDFLNGNAFCGAYASRRDTGSQCANQ